MFLRINLSLMLLLLPFFAEGSLITSDRYDKSDAGTDIEVLKSILSRHPDDLGTLKRLIEITFSLEYFDQTEIYCKKYLAIEKSSDVAYIKILSAASLGKFKSAADQIDQFIGEYKRELNRKDITLLKYRENIYRKSKDVKAYPAGSAGTVWGSGSIIKAVIPREGLYTGYNFKEHSRTIFRIKDDAAIPVDDYPGYLSGLPGNSINFVSLSDDGREVMASSRSGDSSGIYIRRFLPDKKVWSRWEKPEHLNPGRWNHYPNFINGTAVLFSSSASPDESDYDIYVSVRDEDGRWRMARKLSGINTPLDEISIWVHPDGETVYFCSNGYEGMGGFDIYGARLLKKGGSFEVSGITNIVSANTFRNEKYPLFVTPSGSAGYFNFSAGKTRDVYNCGETAVKPVPVFFYTADVVSDSTGLPVSGVAAEYTASGTAYRLNRPVYSDGFTGTVLRRDLNYTITLTVEGYEPFSKTITFSGGNDMVNDKIRLKLRREKPEKIEITETPGIVTVITAINLIGCEKAKAQIVQKTLENSMKIKADSAVPAGIISSLKVCGDYRCALNEGKTVNADFVVFGTIAKKEKSGMKTLGKSGEDQYLAARVTGAEYVIELNLLDASNGKVVVSYKKTTENTDSLKNITEEFIRKVKSFFKGVN